jgi:hypothetical protein
MTLHPARRLTAALLLTLGAIGCGDFARVNPFDPAVPVKLSITGPDRAFSVGDLLQDSLVVDPPYAHEPAVWWLADTHGTMEAFIDPNGLVTVARDRTYGAVLGATQDVTVHVSLGGGRTAEKKLFFVHRPTRLCLLSCDSDKAFTLDSLNPGVNGPAAYADARGNLISPTPPPTIVARTAGVVTINADYNSSSQGIQGYYIGRLGVGSTWVVATDGVFSDSLFVTVTDTVPWHYPY